MILQRRPNTSRTGGEDGGFDAAYIEEGQDLELNVVLFQSKYVRSLDKESNFPANAVEKAVNTIKCIFDPNAGVELNDRSREKVDEIRSFILDGYVPYVKFVMLNNGSKWNQEGQNHIDNAFANLNQVNFEHFNHDNIVGYIQSTKPIDATIQMSGKALHEDFNYKRVMLGRISVQQIYDLMEEYGDRLLEKNIRRYLGKNSVNENISKTLESEEDRQNFFFFNNGITMICNKFSYNGLQEKDWIVRTEGLQIINGGQTCKTIHQTLKEKTKEEYSQSYVLARLYEVNDDEQIVQDITYATNSQNPVDLRDLKSNDKIQIALEISAKDLGETYKRKRDTSVSTSCIPSTVAAEAVLAVWVGKPHLAKYRRTEFFDKYYDEIFGELNAAQMIIAVLIFRYCDKLRKTVTRDFSASIHRAYSQHFLSFMIGKMILDNFNITKDNITHRNYEEIRTFFEENSSDLYKKAESAMTDILVDYFRCDRLETINGRTMAAAFRRFDLIEDYLKNSEWWESR